MTQLTNTKATTLIAGIGNVFLGDDGFGVEVVRRLGHRASQSEVSPWQHRAHIVDFGIRGIDLTYALLDGYERIIFVDATVRGGAPGTLYVLDPDLAALDQASVRAAVFEAHSLVPTKALAMARAMGGTFGQVRVVGCEPSVIVEVDDLDDLVMGLSAPVAAAVDEAVRIIEAILCEDSVD